MAAATPSSARCFCGEAEVWFHHRHRRFRLQCGCCDCRQAGEWGSARGKGAPPVPLILPLSYMANDLTVVKGRERLKALVLRHGFRSVRVVATCCYSTLLVDHPFYKRNVCMVMEPSCRLVAPAMPMRFRGTMDWEEAKYGMRAVYGDPPRWRGDVLDASRKKREAAIFLRVTKTPVALPRRGQSLQQLVKELGGPQPLGLKEARRFLAGSIGKPPTGSAGAKKKMGKKKRASGRRAASKKSAAKKKAVGKSFGKRNGAKTRKAAKK